MEQGLFIATIAGLGGMLGWGLADFFGKKTIDEVGDVVTLAWAHIFGSLILFVAILYRVEISQDIVLQNYNLQTWGLLLFFGVLQAIVYLLVYQGFGKGQVAILSPIFASFSGFTAICSILIFGEIVSKFVFFGLIIIFLGILFINLDLNSLRLKRINFVHIPGFKEIIIATFLAVIWTLLWNKFIEGKDWISYTFFMYVFMTIVIIIVAKIRKIKLFLVKSHIWKYLFFIGLFEIIAYLAISLGYGTTSHTSVIALLSGTFSLPTILLARIFLKEKITAIQTFGSLFIIIGIMVLSIM